MGMLLYACTRSTLRLRGPRALNVKALAHPTSPICPSTLRTSYQTRNLASHSKRKLPTKSAPHQSRIAAYENAAGKLARSSEPLLLYQATNNLPFILGCYSVGAFLITCAIINNHTKLAASKAEVPAWVKVGTALGQCAMVAYGGYMLIKPQNLVKSVISIPSRAPGARSVQLQIERSKSIPFFRPKTYTVPSRDITTSAPLFISPQEQIKAELKELRRQEKEFLQLNREISPYTWPFRVLGHWTSLFFGGFRRAFTSGGLINFHVRGHSLAWKMDTESAWALEGGRSLDEIVKIRD